MLRTTVGGGNVQYERRDVEQAHVDENGAQRSRWETIRYVTDPAELDEANKIRGKARGLVVNACISTSFGLICPEDRVDELDKAVMEARQMCWDFNQRSQHTQIQFNAVSGKVAQDDVAAVEAISLELRDLVATMEAGAAELNVKKIRDAAQRMRDTGQMLSPAVKLKVDDIVKAARKMARKMVKAGEAAAAEVDDQTMAQLRAARTAFLDLDTDEMSPEDQAEAEKAAAEARAAQARAVDLDAWNDDDWAEDPLPEPGDDDDLQGAQAAETPAPSQPALEIDTLDDDTEGN